MHIVFLLVVYFNNSTLYFKEFDKEEQCNKIRDLLNEDNRLPDKFSCIKKVFYRPRK